MCIYIHDMCNFYFWYGHHIISYHIILYYIILYHIISCHNILHHIISYHVISYYIVPYRFNDFYSVHNISDLCTIIGFVVFLNNNFPTAWAPPSVLGWSTNPQSSFQFSLSQVKAKVRASGD